MSYINEIQAGGIDPLRDHRPSIPIGTRHARFAVRIVERDDHDGRYTVHDGTEDTLGDINCAGFWPKATREIPGWAFAWPAVVTTGQRTTTTSAPPSGGGRTTVTPDPHSPGGSGVTVSRAPAIPERTVSTESQVIATSDFQLTLGGSGARASVEAPIRPSGAGFPWDDPAIQPSSWGDHTEPPPTGGVANVHSFWQDIIPASARTVGANAG